MKGKARLFVLAACLFGMLQPSFGEEYKLREAAQYVKDRKGEPIPHVATSEHFALKWGNGNDKNWKFDDAYVQGALKWFEQVRKVYKDQVGLPFVKSERDKYKINIYISETGLIPFLHGYAFGFPDTEGYGVFDADPSCMVWGNFASAHELGHATEGETANFRDSDYVGWFWECCAQFMAAQVLPTALPQRLDLYCDMCQFDWNTASNWHQYSGWIFMQYLTEKPGYGYEFFRRVWMEPSKYQDEDPVNKMVRLKGLTRDGWADLFGDFAKRNVTFASYKYGKQYKASLEKTRRSLSHWKMALEEIKGKPGWYRIPYATAPHQDAYNVIPLTPTAKTISIDFKGLVDDYRKSNWRVTMVIVNEKGGERFSRTIKAGVESVTLKPNEKEVYLVVAAIPHVYDPIKFLQDYRTQDRFPYEVKITGADPKGKVVAKLPEGVTGAPHPNGGGFVASTAKVAATAYVGPNARVLDTAQVSDNARIEDFAVVSGSAAVSGNAIVSGHAAVSGKAAVSGSARVRDYAEVGGATTQVDGNARILEYARVNAGHIYENAVLRGFSGVSGGIHGNAMFTGASCPDGGGIKDCTRGVFTLYVTQDNCDKAGDFDGLLSRYSFDKKGNLLLRDEFATADGFLRGSPEWVADSGRGLALAFNGKDRYVEMSRSISDLRDCRIDINVKWAGGAANQRVFDFGRDAANCIYFTPSSEGGKAAFVMVSNGKTETVTANDALPEGKWVRISIVIKGGTAILNIDGSAAGADKVSASPEDLRADSNYLARGQEGGFFNGALDDLKVYIRDSY